MDTNVENKVQEVEDSFVTVTDDNGNNFKAEIIDIFKVVGYEDNDYVAYTFGEKIDDKNERVYVSKIVELDGGEGFNFAGISDEAEWKAVEAAFNESLDSIGGVSK